MPFNLRRFLLVFFFSTLASLASFLVVQFFQGHMAAFILTAGKALLVGFGLAVMTAIPRRRKDYPWM
jgi:hypothetical protein